MAIIGKNEVNLISKEGVAFCVLILNKVFFIYIAKYLGTFEMITDQEEVLIQEVEGPGH